MSSAFKCIIVDDEYLAQDLLEAYAKKMPGIDLVAKCNNSMEAITALENNEVDLMFLDIQMPDLTGLELLRTLKKRPAVIFTTAYSEHALEGYELDVIDYLLKPIPFDRFVQAVNKATERIRGKQQTLTKEVIVKESTSTAKDHFFVKADHKSVKIRYTDVLYIQGLREYVSIFMKERRVVTLESMKNLEDSLPVDMFIRTHRSFIVAIDKVDAVVGHSLELNKKLIPIGKTYRQVVMAVFS